MPRTIHVTVTYSVYVEDDNLSDKDVFDQVRSELPNVDTIFETKATVFDRWENKVARKGRGSY